MHTFFKTLRMVIGLTVLAASHHVLYAQDDDSFEKFIEAFEGTLSYHTGSVVLPGNLATLELASDFRYLNPEQTERVLVEGWGNPPGTQTLGMICPANVNILDKESWGVIISFREDGYVSDADAERIDYDELLKTMQESTTADNNSRLENGYPPITLVGWAAPPKYDQVNKKLYWAQELVFGESTDHTLNYNIRILGRRGVLVLNAVASMSQLSSVKEDMDQVITRVEFNPGHRYGDYVAGTDKAAEYGLGALVLGGVAAKAGFFKWLFAALLAGKKFVLIGIIALAAMLRKIFGSKETEMTPQTDQPEETIRP